MRPHVTQFTINGRVHTFDEYAAIGTREARMLYRRDAMDAHTAAFKEQDVLLNKIREDADALFAAELEGVPRWIPGALTKTGKPDRRFAERVNPAWRAIDLRKRQVVDAAAAQIAPIVCSWRFHYQYEQVFDTWEACVETPMERLRTLLGRMDWYSHYSDDYSVWQRGEAQMGEAKSLVRKLGPEAEAMFNRACPWLNEDGSRKEDAA